MHKKVTNTRRIVAGSIAGGIIGYILSLLNETMIFMIPGFQQLIAAVPFSAAASLTVAGMVIGGGIGALVPQKAIQYAGGEQGGDAKMTLREEQLNIEKERVKTADVDIHKEVVAEEKNITVPVAREELVVEKGEYDHGKKKETMRIPLSEERIDVDKDTVPLNDVSVHEEQSQDTKTVEETLKKEKLEKDIKGDAKVTEQEDNRQA